MRPKLLRQLRDIGLRGGLKSMYHSVRQTGRPSSLVVTSQVITEIHPETEFKIGNRLTIGTGRRGASHPRIGRSKLHTEPGSTVQHTGRDLAIIGPASVLHVEGEFSMGDSYINSHARILCGDKIKIGDDVSIAWNVQIIDDDRHDLTVAGNPTQKTGPIDINDDVWIGHDVSIHKGVTVHTGSVVASNSVVTSDVPPHTLVAGTPAEVIRQDVEWG